MPRIVNINNEHGSLISCPKCGNHTTFKALSEQIDKDTDVVWVECGVCGFDPTENKTSYRLKDVFGGTTDNNVFAALQCWTEAIIESDKFKVKL